ncbi:hypothetical protein BS50DRAFT_524159, partial [Corynespora cassiicola Philippines]
MDDEEGYHEHRSLFQRIKDTILAPFRLATSPPLLRTYLRTALILLTSSILFGVAVVAYTSFYYAYIPVRGIQVPVYLQYTPHGSETVDAARRHPYGIAGVRGLVARQKYDVVVELELPRSEKNVRAGNWMVGVEMRGPGEVAAAAGARGLLGWGEEWEDVDDFSQGGIAGVEREEKPKSAEAAGANAPVVLARSRRPALLTYRSPVADLAYRLLRLPLYVTGVWRETETLRVSVMEGVEFEKGWRNVPDSVKLELRSRAPLDVYRAEVRVVARLEGLRWVMYHHRLASLLVFTGAFWAVEMSVVVVTWGLFTVLLAGGRQDEDGAADAESPSTSRRTKGRKVEGVKEEDSAAEEETEDSDNFSDTSRTFPTLPSHRPLHYASSSAGEPGKTRIKEERPATPRLEDVPVKTEAEADDEDEDADFLVEEPIPSSAQGALTDSGIGTSMESSVEGKGVRRRGS